MSGMVTRKRRGVWSERAVEPMMERVGIDLDKGEELERKRTEVTTMWGM